MHTHAHPTCTEICAQGLDDRQALKRACEQHDAAMACVRAQLRCAQRAASARGEELASATTTHTAALEAQAADHASERKAVEEKHAAQQTGMRTALAHERERHGETRGLLHSKLGELERARAEKYDAMRAQQAEWQSANANALAKAQRADALEHQLSTLQAKRSKLVSALETERGMRREAELRVIEEQDAAVAAARACAADVRSNNERSERERQDATHLAQQLREQLEVASRLEQVEVAAQLAADLRQVNEKLAVANKANATLRQRVAASGLTRAEEEARSLAARVKDLEQAAGGGGWRTVGSAHLRGGETALHERAQDERGDRAGPAGVSDGGAGEEP